MMDHGDLIALQLSNYRIEKATARLAHQRAAIRRLGFDADQRLAELAQGTLLVLESRLAELLVGHASLVTQQQRNITTRARPSVRQLQPTD